MKEKCDGALGCPTHVTQMVKQSALPIPVHYVDRCDLERKLEVVDCKNEVCKLKNGSCIRVPV